MPHILRISSLTAISLVLSLYIDASPGSTKGIIQPDQSEAPADAVQLVGPESYRLIPEKAEVKNQWVFKDGVLTASPKWDSLITEDVYEDFRLHVEFNVNDRKDAKEPEENGNSGIYIQQRYEVQILNSYGVKAADYKASYAGSLYKLKKPDKLVSRPAGEWQSYDIVFRAARYKDGKKTTARASTTTTKSRARLVPASPRAQSPVRSGSRATIIRYNSAMSGSRS